MSVENGLVFNNSLRTVVTDEISTEGIVHIYLNIRFCLVTIDKKSVTFSSV